MQPRTTVIVNPSSQGGKLGKRWRDHADVIGRAFPFDEVITEGPGHATELTRAALKGGAERIVAIGGDGTVNEVTNGFFENGEPIAPDASFALIPYGTGGDFRRTLELPTDFADAVAVVAANQRKKIDMGRLAFTRMDGAKALRMFANIASFGVSGVVDRLVNESGKKLGRVSFMLATARATWSYKNQRVQLVFDGGERVEATINTVAVANGKFFGGAMKVAPHAELDDGQFDVICMGDLTFGDLLTSGRKLYSGTHLAMPKVTSRRARVVEAEPIEPGAVVELDVDGEAPGKLPARFEIVPGALWVIVPRGNPAVAMLHVIHGNRSEALLGALLEALPPVDPFAPSTIVVGSHLIARWLTRELAFARGIAAGVELVTFDQFVATTWGDQLAGLDRRQLAALLASVLADAEITRGLAPVAAYLAAAPGDGDRAGPRRVQLAEHLAGLWWSYAMTRPDWMPALIAGRVPGELEADPAARWQAALIGEAIRRADHAVPVPMLPWARRRAGLPTPRLPGPVAVFGMSFLARAQLEALSDLAATTDISLYLLDPCEELWDDVAGRRAAEIADPLPLVMWGRPVRDTISALVERTGGDLEARFELGAPATARDLLFADVMARRVATVTATASEAGVIVHACPNPRREIEVVAEVARRALDADPTLRAHEIAVWIAGDAERYLAQAPAAFESAGVPCHLIDAPIDDRGRIGEAVLALLELPTSTMARRDLLRVMTHPALLAGYPHADAEDWVRWTDRLGIAHGADGRAHDGTYLEEHRGQFHWDQGVRRLALGAFMVGDTSQRGPVKIADLVVEPEEVRPDQQASAATYALLVRSLCADAEWLARFEAPLARWAEVLVGLVDTYLVARTTEAAQAARDHERVRGMLAGLAHLDLDGRPVGFREVREHAARMLDTARSNRGEPLASGAMIAPLAAMRAVPARVVFVIGLDEGAFPAGDRPSPLDLRRDIRPGDVSPRDRDRAAFLEVLLGARDALHLSYVAIEAKSGQMLAPSSVVLELADALAPYLGAPSSREALAQITVRHPLHRFGDADDARPAVQRERWALAVRDELRAHVRAAGRPIPDEDGVLALLAHPSQEALRVDLGVVAAPVARSATALSRPISVSNLRTFLEHPVQAWAQVVLALEELPDESVVDDSDEPFHLARNERAVMLREVFAAQLREQGDVVARYTAAADRLTLKNQFPVGVFGEAARALDLRMLRVWREALGPIAVGGATRYGFGRASSPGAQLVPALELDLGDGRRVRIVGQTELLLRGPQHTSIITMIRKLEKRSPYHLRGAFDHVLLAAAGIANAGHVHRLIDRHGDTKEVRHEPWTQADARAYLAGLVTELLDGAHGYLLPFESLVKALSGGKVSRIFGDPTSGLGYGPIDRLDGLEHPEGAPGFAARRLGPLVARMIGSDFEVAA